MAKVAIFEAEIDLTQEERDIAQNVHRFAENVMRPVGRRLDQLPDPTQVIEPRSELWQVFNDYSKLGLDPFAMINSELTLYQQARLRSIIAEELGWGDAGLAVGLGVSIFPKVLALLSGKPEFIEKFGHDNIIGCWPITEPDHGSDVILYGGRFSEFPGKPNCIAIKDGDSFIIKGQKSAWVSNGTIAHAAALFCAVDLGEGPIGLGGFLVPLDEPGVRKGKPLDKIGQRALNQGEIYFDDVRLSKDHLVLPPGGEGLGMDVGLAQANALMGSTFVGVAQAAFDLALQYSKERVQGGVPIFNHQSVKGRLFVMYRKLEAARNLSRQAVLRNTLGMPSLPLAVASKVTATETAFEVASAALQIYGGNGLSKDYPIEKLLRDARASMIEDGCNEVLSLVAAERL